MRRCLHRWTGSWTRLLRGVSSSSFPLRSVLSPCADTFCVAYWVLLMATLYSDRSSRTDARTLLLFLSKAAVCFAASLRIFCLYSGMHWKAVSKVPEFSAACRTTGCPWIAMSTGLPQRSPRMTSTWMLSAARCTRITSTCSCTARTPSTAASTKTIPPSSTGTS